MDTKNLNGPETLPEFPFGDLTKGLLPVSDPADRCYCKKEKRRSSRESVGGKEFTVIESTPDILPSSFPQFFNITDNF